jgi:hypothetical protein
MNLISFYVIRKNSRHCCHNPPFMKAEKRIRDDGSWNHPVTAVTCIPFLGDMYAPDSVNDTVTLVLV